MLSFKKDVVYVELPNNATQKELLQILSDELKIKEKRFYGLDLKINGRITTGMCIMIGHKLSHICKTISIFDPKENEYVLCVQH